MSTRLSILALAICLLCAAATSGANLKLAVIGDAAVRDKALTDELTVKLAELKTITLVDREQLDAVMKEQALKSMLDRRVDRERIGKLLSADILALLTLDPAKPGIRLILCDARSGLTLADTTISPEPRDKALDGLVGQIGETVKQFAAGVTYVAAVPDLVSRDLTFDRQYLQTDFANLIRAAYQQTPGVALVSIEEAKAIAQERELTGDNPALKNRPAPAFVEGEYRTETQAEGKWTVRLTLVLRNASGRSLAEKTIGPVPIEEAGPAILEFYNAKFRPLIEAVGNFPAPDPEGQFKLLIDRAGQFAEVGEFRRSAALREAALLLKPDATDQRILLIREYTRRNSRPVEQGEWPKGAKMIPSDPFWMAIVDACVLDWKRSLVHCEYLVRNRKVSRQEASGLAGGAIHSITGVRMTVPPQLVECERLKKQFIREVFSAIPKLDSTPRGKPAKVSGDADAIYFPSTSILFRCDGNFFDNDDLDLIADMILKYLPANTEPNYELNFFLRRAGENIRQKKEKQEKGYTEAELMAFLDRLAQSDRKLAQVYGRFGKFCYRRYANHESSPELLAESKAVVALAESVGFDLRKNDYFMGRLRDEVVWMEMEQRRKTKPAEVAGAPPQAPATRPARRIPAAPPPRKPEVIPPAMVSLDPVKLTLQSNLRKEKDLSPGLRWRGSGGWGNMQHFRVLGPNLDVMWSAGGVLLIADAQNAVEILADEKLAIGDVTADGKYLWASGGYEQGLFIFDLKGKRIGQVNKEHGLPPTYYNSPRLQPLGPGRMLATGSFGNEKRGWIAIIDFDGTAPRVEIILEATKVRDWSNSDPGPVTDPSVCFEPEVAFLHTTAGAKPRQLVYIVRDRNVPLIVDPVTKKVSVYPNQGLGKYTFPRNDPPADSFMSIDGVLWVAGSNRDARPFTVDPETGVITAKAEPPGNRNGGAWHSGNATQGWLARDGDWLYSAGNEGWRRVNLKTGNADPLITNPRQLPNYGSGSQWELAMSQQLGLVAFNNGQLYRVKLDESLAK